MKSFFEAPVSVKLNATGGKDQATGALPIFLLLGLMTLTNFIISYTSFTTDTKLILFLMGVLIPTWGLTRKDCDDLEKGTPFYQKEFLPPIPYWGWALLLIGAFVIRFWKLSSLFLWPYGDEALTALAGIDLCRRWDWHYFYAAGQDPPTLFWISGLLNRFSHGPFFNMWFPPALISCLSILAGTFAVRQYFSRSFSFLCVGLLAFSYWPLYLSRVNFAGVFVLFWWPLTLFSWVNTFTRNLLGKKFGASY